jgi:hypothetical protein
MIFQNVLICFLFLHTLIIIIFLMLSNVWTQFWLANFKYICYLVLLCYFFQILYSTYHYFSKGPHVSIMIFKVILNIIFFNCVKNWTIFELNFNINLLCLIYHAFHPQLYHIYLLDIVACNYMSDMTCLIQFKQFLVVDVTYNWKINYDIQQL